MRDVVFACCGFFSMRRLYSRTWSATDLLGLASDKAGWLECVSASFRGWKGIHHPGRKKRSSGAADTRPANTADGSLELTVSGGHQQEKRTLRTPGQKQGIHIVTDSVFLGCCGPSRGSFGLGSMVSGSLFFFLRPATKAFGTGGCDATEEQNECWCRADT